LPLKNSFSKPFSLISLKPSSEQHFSLEEHLELSRALWACLIEFWSSFEEKCRMAKISSKRAHKLEEKVVWRAWSSTEIEINKIFWFDIKSKFWCTWEISHRKLFILDIIEASKIRDYKALVNGVLEGLWILENGVWTEWLFKERGF